MRNSADNAHPLDAPDNGDGQLPGNESQTPDNYDSDVDTEPGRQRREIAVTASSTSDLLWSALNANRSAPPLGWLFD